MSSETRVDTRTLKRVILSERPVSGRPAQLDELKPRYEPIFSVKKEDAYAFSLRADARMTMCAMEDRPLRRVKFTMLLPAVLANESYPFEEVMDESGEHSDIASAIADLLEVDNANYGIIAGDLRRNTITGDPIFRAAINPCDINFVMFYTDKKPKFSDIVEGRTVVQIGNIWMVMLPLYLLAKNF